MSNPRAGDMVEAYLHEKGYDGLYHDDEECACKLDDLFPCSEVSDCSAGYLVKIEDAPEGFDFTIVAEKPETGESG